jgi:hypothetical protein
MGFERGVTGEAKNKCGAVESSVAVVMQVVCLDVEETALGIRL